MALLDYIEAFDDVRAALGVSEHELSDATLSSSLYEDSLAMEFLRVDAAFRATLDAALAAPAPTAAQQHLKMVGRLFAVYALARQAGHSLPLAVPKDETDGKAGLSRYGDTAWATVLGNVQALAERYRGAVQEALLTVTGTTAITPRSLPFLLGVSSPNSDPVTGT